MKKVWYKKVYDLDHNLFENVAIIEVPEHMLNKKYGDRYAISQEVVDYVKKNYKLSLSTGNMYTILTDL